MQREQMRNIVMWSTAALIIPILGQLLVEGWNWGWNEFLFAWVFFNIFGFTSVFITNKITHRIGKIAIAIGITAFFTLIWVMLATG
jgi:hypothetical protein